MAVHAAGGEWRVHVKLEHVTREQMLRCRLTVFGLRFTTDANLHYTPRSSPLVVQRPQQPSFRMRASKYKPSSGLCRVRGVAAVAETADATAPRVVRGL